MTPLYGVRMAARNKRGIQDESFKMAVRRRGWISGRTGELGVSTVRRISLRMEGAAKEGSVEVICFEKEDTNSTGRTEKIAL